MERRITAVLLLAFAAGGCREGVQPFTPSERDVSGDSYALTFGYGHDADPRWSPSGDTIFYHTTRAPTIPQVAGVLLAIPANGGAALPVMPDLQEPGGRPFVTPAISPDGQRVAYMDLMSVDAPGACFRLERQPDGTEVPPECRDIQPLLDSAVLRVRRIGAPGSIAADPGVPVKFAGTDPGHRFMSDGPWYERLFPFQALHRSDHAMLFRPSWAPDGERIVYSDGLALRIWNVDDPVSTVIPGTEDGVSAAWSPGGEWIAFTVLPRTDSVVYECSCSDVQAFRTVYASGAGTLVLVRPDGSERTELGEGEDPAWSPDGAFIYVRRGTGIFRVARAGGAAAPVPNTEGGRAPAVSPDGQRLAFSRSKPSQLTLDYDIWVVSLEQ